jgi:toxin YoeB
MNQVVFDKLALEQLEEWSKVDLKTVRKIIEIITDIRKHPFEGIGKPEPLKHELKGFWSRRITQEHRLIYKVNNNILEILSCKGHY